jgi:hypothetical protein
MRLVARAHHGPGAFERRHRAFVCVSTTTA